MRQLTTTRIQAETASATVTSTEPEVTAWARRYFGTWWNATDAAPGTDAAAALDAEIDPDAVHAALTQVTGLPHRETVYAGARTLVTDPDSEGVIRAVQPEAELAFVYGPYRTYLSIHGTRTEPVAVAAARLAREMIRGQLLAAGFHILHASAVARDGRALLTLGAKGAGKTSCALLLARSGWQLLANDRVFVRAEPDGLRVLPWPAAAAIGLGLLEGMGLYEQVRARVLAGEQLHPTQHQRVTDALHAGSTTPIWDEKKGKELKPQFHPDQLHTWLGMPLATGARAAGLLFPTVAPGTTPSLGGEPRTLAAGDFFTSGTEDRYPDIFRLLPPAADPADLVARLAALPSQALVLTHDAPASAKVLTDAAHELITR